MRTLYIDCGMGAAGDMLTAALLELTEDPAAAVAALNSLGIPGVKFTPEQAKKCGITGTHMHVTVNGEEEAEFHHHHHHGHHHEQEHEHDHHDHGHEHHHDHHDHEHEHHHDHEHHHSGMAEITHLISHLRVSEAVRSNIRAVYTQIAQAESHVHGEEMEHIHFHEVGSMDAVADVTAVCWLLEQLGVQQVIASPVHVGSGTVHCAHGILPVPAPATAHILRGVPIYSGDIKGELCTPTGAALLKTFVSKFAPMPAMTVEKIGYGMGSKDFDRANCVRVLLGETENTGDTIAQLSCNIDDMTAEEIGFASEALMAQGALDVFTTPIGMKKGRPATMLTVLCKEYHQEDFAASLFRLTSTLGVRVQQMQRYTLQRQEETMDTPYGPVTNKTVTGYGITRSKLEYEDLARIAREKNVSLAAVREAIKKGNAL